MYLIVKTVVVYSNYRIQRMLILKVKLSMEIWSLFKKEKKNSIINYHKIVKKNSLIINYIYGYYFNF